MVTVLIAVITPGGMNGFASVDTYQRLFDSYVAMANVLKLGDQDWEPMAPEMGS